MYLLWRTCEMCGCTEHNPCVAEDGSTCAWANVQPPVVDICTFCLDAVDKEEDVQGRGKDQEPER